MTTWNPADKSTIITLTNSDLTAAASVNVTDCAVRSTTSKSSGKFYFEVVWAGSPGGGDTGLGIATSTANLSFLGSTDIGVAIIYQNTGSIYVNGSGTGIGLGAAINNNTVCIAVDLVNSRIWFRNSAGNWNGNPSADPATNTAGVNISALFPTNAAYAVASFNSSGPTATARFTTASFVYTPPSGFSEFDTPPPPVVTGGQTAVSVNTG